MVNIQWNIKTVSSLPQVITELKDRIFPQIWLPIRLIKCQFTKQKTEMPLDSLLKYKIFESPCGPRIPINTEHILFASAGECWKVSVGFVRFLSAFLLPQQKHSLGSQWQWYWPPISTTLWKIQPAGWAFSASQGLSGADAAARCRPVWAFPLSLNDLKCRLPTLLHIH